MEQRLISIASNIVSIALSVFTVNTYFKIFFDRKVKSKLAYLIWGIYIFQQLALFNGRLTSIQNVCLSIILFILIVYVQYYGEKYQKIIFAIALFGVFSSMEFIIALILMYLKLFETVSIPIGGIISNCFSLFIILMLKRYYKRESIKLLPNKYKFLLLIVPIGSTFVIYSFFSLYSISEYYFKYNIILIIAFIILLIINIIIFNLYLRLSQEIQLKMENAVYENQILLNSKFMLEKENIFQELRRYKHDIKNHLITINEMLDKNKISSAESYIKVLLDKKEINGYSIIDTGNLIIDSLINAKYNVAIAKGIEFKLDIHIPIALPFNDTDTCIILGNILDNAIEATEKVDADKRYINILMKFETNELIIVCINSFDGQIKTDDKGRLVTTKVDFDQHGIGITSIERLALRYNGRVLNEYTADTFTVKILLLAQ